jgi:hypothetical protein
MCARAVKLQKYIDEWLKVEIAANASVHPASITHPDNDTEIDTRDFKRLRLSSTEWHHLELVTEMLKRFKDATVFLSEIHKPQIQYIWLMYNRLFDFLDQLTDDFEEDSGSNNNSDWPDIVKAAAEKGKAKLRKYYAKTGGEQGFLFNCATILDPTQKLTAYEVCLSQLINTVLT